VPGVPGFKAYNLYAFRGANAQMAEKYAPDGIPGAITVFHGTSPGSANAAQVVEYNLKQIGATTKDKPVPFSIYSKSLGTKGADFDMASVGWCADYADPFDYINVNLDGRSIQATNNVNFAYMNNKALNAAMDRAASLTGDARTAAYQALDYEIMKSYAPWVPYAIANGVYFVSSRVHNYVYNAFLGEPDPVALSVG